MKVVAYTNMGPVRDHNEDALFAGGNVISGTSMPGPQEIDEGAFPGCLVVIDGMGGYEGGELAARLVANSLLEEAQEAGVRMRDIAAEIAKERIAGALRRAVRHITRAITETPGLSPMMGATLAGVALCSNGVLTFNCGDCRVYRQQSGYLERLTHDHSLVQELCDQGDIDEEGMRTHPRKNTVTACVSADLAYLNVYFRRVPYATGGRFFLCSDGVWETLPVEGLESCLRGQTLMEGATTLAGALLAPGSGCRDNISFFFIDPEKI